MITIQEIPVEQIDDFWTIQFQYLIDDGMITEEEEKAYFQSSEYRGVLKGHMLRAQDKLHMVYFVRDGLRIGACQYCTYQSEDGKCFILDFWVFPEYRGNGTGHACFQALLAYTKRDGAVYYSLNYAKEDSRRFWLSLGFTDSGADEYGAPLMQRGKAGRLEERGVMKTERLTIAPFEMKYLRDYFDGFDGEITKYQWPDPFVSVDSARDLLQGFLDEMARGEGLVFSILSHDGRFLGGVEVHALPEECPELGVWIIKSEQNKGYAYEALRAVLDYTRAGYDKRAFFYEADVRNEASIKLLRKLEDGYEIMEQGLEECTTDSGKVLRLQGYILKAKET